MIALTVLAAAGAAALLVQQPTSNEVDPLYGPLPSGENDPARLHARVRKEAPDPVWARRAEQILRARYSRIAHITGPGREVRVLCGATLCEVAGELDAPFRQGHEYDRNDPLNKAMRELQASPLRDDLLKVGLEGQGGTFTGSAGKPKLMVFLQYYLRKGAESK